MSVRKRSWVTRKGEAKEAWVADYTDGAGARHIKTFDKKKDADNYASKTRTDVNAGTHVTLGAMTVAKAAENWLNHCKAIGRHRGTVEQYGRNVRLHIVPRIGALKLSNLSVQGVKKFRDALLQDDNKLSVKMARKVWVSFKSLLKHEHCKHLADGVRIEASTNSHDIEEGRDFPTPPEVARVIEAAGDNLRYKTFLILAAFTGLRTSEILGLRWSDVEDDKLHVRQRADRYRQLGAPKTKSSKRTVPFGKVTDNALKTWKLACPPNESGLVFPSPDGRVISVRNFSRRVYALIKDAHIVTKDGRAKYSPHSFRHFFASWCINPKPMGRGLPAKVVQEWLGHSSIKITLDIYGHLFKRNENMDEINAAENAVLGLDATQTRHSGAKGKVTPIKSGVSLR
jgi:integrase